MFSVMFYYLMFDIDEVLYIMLLITGITAFQRYYNKNHTILQILVGLFVGGAFAWIVYYFVKKYKNKILMLNNNISV
jgi:membrane-associated phospholipid phosphatase